MTEQTPDPAIPDDKPAEKAAIAERQISANERARHARDAVYEVLRQMRCEIALDVTTTKADDGTLLVRPTMGIVAVEPPPHRHG